MPEVPLILHRCPNCKRIFDSPSVCLDDGSSTEPFVRTIKVAIWRALPPGQPQGVGMGEVDADVTILVDFDQGGATVYPRPLGEAGSSGPARTPGLNLDVVVERKGRDA